MQRHSAAFGYLLPAFSGLDHYLVVTLWCVVAALLLVPIQQPVFCYTYMLTRVAHSTTTAAAPKSQLPLSLFQLRLNR